MPNYKNLFLRQSYLDSYDEYEKSLTNIHYAKWDYVILTASNESQAQAFREQIDYRLKAGRLPLYTHYAVIPDIDGKRIGSGGATLGAMRYIMNHSEKDNFSGLRILVIHSGGDSKRVPQYSACGKLFSPVPRKLKNGNTSTLFDEFIIGLSGVPSRINDGMLVVSGDVLLVFNPLQIDFHSEGAAAISIAENVETAQHHGVFVKNSGGDVSRFLHKQTPEALYDMGAVNESGKVDIDTGAIILDANILSDLYALVDTDEKFKEFVNDTVRLSFYADFVYPLAKDSTLEQYLREVPEGKYSKELEKCRTKLWEVLHKYKMKLLCMSPASFIHFGTTQELLKLMTEDMDSYRFLEWFGRMNTNYKAHNAAVVNSYINKNVVIGDSSFIEDSYIHRGTVIGEGCVISGVTLENITIPPHTVLHGLKLKSGEFVVRMFSTEDNPKEPYHFGKEIDTPLWYAKVFPVCKSIIEAVNSTVNNIPSYAYMSLEESFNEADVTQILPWKLKLNDKIKTEELLEAIDDRVSVEEAKKIFVSYSGIKVSDKVRELLTYEAEQSDISRKIRIYYYMSRLFTDSSRELYENTCYSIIRDSLLENVGYEQYKSGYKITKNEVSAKLPLRINFGGGWSDTPPYCIENGGTVLNAAITLNGRLPIEVSVERIDENAVIFESTDNGSYRKFTNIRELQAANNPHDTFALHKAAIIAAGIIPSDGPSTLDSVLTALGGGFKLTTCARGVPRGSGLGTSSILSAGCIRVLLEFTGREPSADEVFARVLMLEQIMGTGGGWQDQAGGYIRGIKILTTKASPKQTITSTQISVSEKTLAELSDRFCLIFTGQRRLARNLLREVVGKYIGADPEAIDILNEIQRIAYLMKFELEKGNISEFANLMNEHWELSKKLDAGCTNTCIDQIILSCKDLICGKMISGAGGGGFIQVILKKGVTKETLHERLKSVFADSGVDVWSCEFYM